jgi:thioredoxin 1
MIRRQRKVGAQPQVRGAHAMASENVVEFTDQNFEAEVLKSSTPVLVDFWAEWCMPCRMLTPTIEKIAKDYAGKVKVGKLDTDANRDVAAKYSISAIPTVILFKEGQVAQKFVGLRQEKDFKAALDGQ